MPLDNITLEDISKLLVMRYIHVAIATVRLSIIVQGVLTVILFYLQAWLWDMTISCSTEVEAFSHRKLSIVDFVYMASR